MKWTSTPDNFPPRALCKLRPSCRLMTLNDNAITAAVAQGLSSLSTAHACAVLNQLQFHSKLVLISLIQLNRWLVVRALALPLHPSKTYHAHKVAPSHTEAVTPPSQAIKQDNTSSGIALANPLSPIDSTSEVLPTLKVALQQAATASSSAPASMYNAASSGITLNGPTATTSTAHSAAAFSTPKALPQASTFPKISSRVTNPLRVDVGWSPKDFTKLKKSFALMFSRFAPFLSGFDTTHPWVAEWQTDQMANAHIIEPAQLAQFPSIRKITSVKQQCFYFSFCLNATGSQFLQVLKSKALQVLKQGEKISFDTSHIPPIHGEASYKHRRYPTEGCQEYTPRPLSSGVSPIGSSSP